MADDVLLRCEKLEVGYGGKAILPPVDLELRAGEFWAVIGRNGSGKSTWFRTLLGLLPAVSGRVLQPGGPVELAYVGQRMAFDPLFPVTAREVVTMGTMRRWSFLKPSLKAPPIVDEALEAVDAAGLATRSFRALSEAKQRVLLARMVASGARLALLDEPTAAMDAVAERQAMELIDRVRQRFGMAVLVVSHHLEATLPLAERALFVDPDHDAVVVGAVDDVCRHRVFIARYGAHIAEGLHG